MLLAVNISNLRTYGQIIVFVQGSDEQMTMTYRLHCSTDTNQVRRPSLFCCRSEGLEQSPGVRQIDEDSCQF